MLKRKESREQASSLPTTQTLPDSSDSLAEFRSWLFIALCGASIDNSEACATILEDRDTVDVETNVGINFGGEVVDLDSGDEDEMDLI
ncbi:hypothetical protein BVRB_8g185990 [Beta vulgaris subsp. vulgaris]|nr:hypothetical protein BVRB_8g185990 [Beta vulgaris subsp. vulgaris]